MAGSGMSRKALRRQHHEQHKHLRAGWLRAAVLGADDGIVSTSSIMLGVATASGSKAVILVAGVAGLAAGALSMAAGEYVSVSSQRDTELADIDIEAQELRANPRGELEELVGIYRKRGLDDGLARKVAEQLTATGRGLEAHLRDELGFHEASRARPVQAALVSATSFASLAALPIAALLVAPAALRIPVIACTSLVSLACLGALGGYLGGASLARPALRVVFGGGLAMAVTALVGRLFGLAGLG